MIVSKARTVPLGDGEVTHVDQWGEAGPILIGIHGITSSRKSWERFAQRFAADYRIVAYDQRGHGDSANVMGPMTLERSLEDLQRVVASLHEPVFGLLGHSWGGAVAIVGGRRVDCRRVIAIDPMIHQAPGTWYAEFVDELRAVLNAPPQDREPLIRDYYAEWPAIDIDAKVHAMRRMSIEPIIALGHDNGVDAGKWDIRRDVASYPKPLLLPVADPAASVVSAPDLLTVAQTGGPNVTIEVFTGEGHSLQRTAFDKFAAMAAAFLSAR